MHLLKINKLQLSSCWRIILNFVKFFRNIGGNLRSAQCWPTTDCHSPSTGRLYGVSIWPVLARNAWLYYILWHTKMPTFRQYWVNCRLSVLANCTGPVLLRWWTPAEYRNFHLGIKRPTPFDDFPIQDQFLQSGGVLASCELGRLILFHATNVIIHFGT